MIETPTHHETRNESGIDAPFIEADADASPQTLRTQFERDGYLFFRALVPEERVLQVRRDVMDLCEHAGWLDPHSDSMQAKRRENVGPYSEGMPEYMPTYRQILRTPSFHDFPTEAALTRIAGAILDIAPQDVLVHPRRIGRITWPGFARATTPAHQDHFYIRGALDTVSCWIPLGECPIELGGLAVWPGSHRNGFIEHSEHLEGAVGGRGVPVDESQATWHASDFGLGDALFFTSLTIHKALPNISGDTLRISTDNRYQRPQDAIDPGALKPHFG